MKKSYFFLIGALAALTSFNVSAAAAKGYQVTGPVLGVTNSMIAVQKGQDRWEIIRDANTKVTGDLKVGAKVTIQYTMTAQSVEVKTAGGAAASKPAAKPVK